MWPLLALLCAISPALSCAMWPFGSDDSRRIGERAAQILSRAIAIPSVNPPGREARLAEFLVEVADDAGLETRVIETPTEEAPDEEGDRRRAAGWARLRGTGAERPIILLSHLDVVPADPAEWTTPPFEGRIEGGEVIGRGALDAKGVAVIQLMTLLELAKREEPLTRDVIWLATPDEESGGVLGAGYIVAERPDLLDGAEYVLTEGGNVRSATGLSPSIWGVSVTEKSPCWLELTARGAPGHTSSPTPDAAVPRLVEALDAVRRLEMPIDVLPEVQRMFEAMASTAPPEDQTGYLDLRSALSQDFGFRQRFLGNPERSALVRNTLSITVLEGAIRTNVAPARARAQLDVRLLPGERCEDFAHSVRNVVADTSVSVHTLLAFPSGSSPIETDLYRAIERVAARDDPNAIVVPRMTAGFTDAHFFREIGMVAYGFVPRWLTAGETRGIHGANERVSIENLERATRTLVAIIEELAAPR